MIQQNNHLVRFFTAYCILLSASFRNCNAFNCHLPFGCQIENIHFRYSIYAEKAQNTAPTILCDVQSGQFEFKYPEPVHITNDSCFFNINDTSSTIIRWLSNNDLAIFDKQFNFNNAIRYFSNFDYLMNIHLYGVKGFDLNIFENDFGLERTFLKNIFFIDIRLEFYHNKERINSCQQIIDLNLTNVRSIFQITNDKNSPWSEYYDNFVLEKVEYKSKICPLVFKNTYIQYLLLMDLVDSFYKKSVLTFTNDSFATINSSLKWIHLGKFQNINLDLNFLNPSVFNNTRHIYIESGSLNSISEEIFKVLTKLYLIVINPMIFRKINHKQGIKWIRNINYGVNINLNKINFTQSDKVQYKDIDIEYEISNRKRIENYLPEEDFCIYVDFPFDQLVIFIDRITWKYDNKLEESIIEKYHTCTYLWLMQHYEYYYKFFKYFHKTSHDSIAIMMTVINSTAFKSISKCDFDRRKSLCNKSNYQVKDIWDDNDFYILNKKMQTAFKISLYPVSFLCLFTNLIVVVVILKKDNNDLFKEYKHYSYLCSNSVFCILISVIELLSWMTECFYPFEVFCPEIRKLVAFQFFKIIFKECLVTVFTFMCSFTYIAFALNRISLIGKDHGKLVTFISEVGFKKYIGVTIIISIIFSWIKFFKYDVNYYYPYANYPISNELDIISSEHISLFNDFYFIYNSISDVLNYLIFVIISVVIDICMVVQLRRVLEDKSKKSVSLNQKQSQTKKAENEEVVNKAIKMVVLNSAIGILFKLPVSFIPIINLPAQFFYKSIRIINSYPLFHEFYLTLFNSGFNFLIQDVSDLLFTFSLAIQMFIYKRFDKKFRTGYDRMKEDFLNFIKSRFNK